MCVPPASPSAASPSGRRRTPPRFPWRHSSRVIVELWHRAGRRRRPGGAAPPCEASASLPSRSSNPDSKPRIRPMSPEQGKARGLLVGRYLILDKLGHGGNGGCFQGTAPVARPCGRTQESCRLRCARCQRELVLRFRRVMQAAAWLKTPPHGAMVLDADEDRGAHFPADGFHRRTRPLSSPFPRMRAFLVEQTSRLRSRPRRELRWRPIRERRPS